MRNLTLVLVFLLGLCLKTSMAFGDNDADFESSGDVAHYYQPSQQPVVSQPIAPPPQAIPSNGNGAYVNSGNGNSEWQNVTPNSPVQSIQNNNNINLAPNAHNSNAMGPNGPVNGSVAGPAAVSSSSLAYGSAEADAASVLGTRERYRDPYYRVSLMPMVGGSIYSGQWGDHIGNQYTFGMIVAVPMTHYLDFEAEGSYAQYNISYSYNPALRYNHDFQQYSLGGNLKAYLTRGVFRPYLGGGISGIYFNNMTHGPYFPATYSQWVGFGQLMGGADVNVSDDIALGGRASWYIPMFNRPVTADNGMYSFPYYEEAGAINTSFYRLMATLKIAL